MTTVVKTIIVLCCVASGVALGRFALFPLLSLLIPHSLNIVAGFVYLGMMGGIGLTLGAIGGLWLGLVSANYYGQHSIHQSGAKPGAA